MAISLFPFIEELKLEYYINYSLFICSFLAYFSLVGFLITKLNVPIEKEVFDAGIRDTNTIFRRFFFIQITISLILISTINIVTSDYINQSVIGWLLLLLLGYVLLPFHANEKLYKYSALIFGIASIMVPVLISLYEKYEIIEDFKVVTSSFGAASIQWALSLSK